MKNIRNLKHIFIIILISLFVLFGLITLFSDEFTDNINGLFIYRTTNNVWQDKIYKHSLHPSQDIVIITIDEETLNTLQAKNNLSILTVPKSTYSDLVTKLEGAGVKGIGFDIIFQNADPTEDNFRKNMENYSNIVIAANYVEDLCSLTYGSIWTRLNEKLKLKYPKKVLAQKCESTLKEILRDSIDMDKKYFAGTDTLLKSSNSLTKDEKLAIYCILSDTTQVINCPGLPRSIYKNIPWGIVDIQSSYERVLSVPIMGQPYQDWKIGSGSYTTSDTEMQSLAARLYMQTNPDKINFISKIPYFYKKINREIGEKAFKTTLSTYFGSENNSYRKISMSTVLDMSRVDLISNFNGKYVFIGESGTMIHDSMASPVTGGKMDGVESHAHFLDGILQNKMLDRVSDSTLWIVTIFLLILTVFLYFYLPTLFSLIFAIVSLVATLWASRYIYDSHRLVIDIFPLFLSVFVISFPTTYIYRFFIVDREKRFIENAFGHYIDPKMVEMIDMEEVSLTLGGEERNLSVFFSDIAGFTTISEKLSPADLFYLMSSYLSRMTDILKAEGGTLDKYIGDAVMGFFGAPVAQTDHAIRVCRTALAMRRALPDFNREIRERGIEEIDFRIGIATGDVLVGNIGSTDHFNYTVLGDTVNLASRLEATGKEYGVHAIISEGTRTRISDTFELRELDTIAVKGKTEGIKIYELLGYKSDNIDRTIYDTYETALVLYREQKYMEAGRLWETIQDRDVVSQIMMNRCIEIIKGNIRVENGVYHMTHK